MRLAAVASVFLFSSPEPPVEGCVLWPVLADVEAVALLAGLRTLATGGRVGGLLKPPEAFVVDDAVGFVTDDVAARGRLGPTAGRFGGTFSFFAPFASADGVSFSVSVSISDVVTAASSPDRISVGASPCCGSEDASTSAILTTEVNRTPWKNLGKCELEKRSLALTCIKHCPTSEVLIVHAETDLT